MEGRAPRDSHLALKNLTRRAGLKYNPDRCKVTQLPLVREIARICLLAALAAAPPAYTQTPGAAQAAQDTPESHLGKGYDALRQDRYEEAAREFRAALALDPKLVMRARFPLAVALFEQKQSIEARREFETVRHEIGEHPNVSYYLGRLDLMAQNFDGAIRNLNQAIAKPPFPDTAYYLGLAYFKRGDWLAAEKWLKKAAEINPRDSLAQYQLGLAFRKEGREEEARKALALSAELRRRDADDSQLRSECARKLDTGPPAEAHDVCERLYDSENAEKLTALGTIYGQHGALEAALKPLRRAAELAPQSPQMQYNLAFTYFRLNRFEEARTPIANAVKRWPDIFQLNALYGAVLSKLGEDLAACEALRRAHQLNQTDSQTTNLLYATLLALARKSQAARDYSDSLRYFSEAANLRPADPEPHRSLAEIYTLTGHPAEAAAEEQQADQLSKNLNQPR